MSKHNDGGPAFPVANGPDTGWAEGMTLRDYFAAKAMMHQTVLPANLWQAIRWMIGLEYRVSRCDPKTVASIAYQQADAMLAAREAR